MHDGALREECGSVVDKIAELREAPHADGRQVFGGDGGQVEDERDEEGPGEPLVQRAGHAVGEVDSDARQLGRAEGRGRVDEDELVDGEGRGAEAVLKGDAQGDAAAHALADDDCLGGARLTLRSLDEGEDLAPQVAPGKPVAEGNAEGEDDAVAAHEGGDLRDDGVARGVEAWEEDEDGAGEGAGRRWRRWRRRGEAEEAQVSAAVGRVVRLVVCEGGVGGDDVVIWLRGGTCVRLEDGTGALGGVGARAGEECCVEGWAKPWATSCA